jgi:O-acetyl-ADP-ribose deacetylase (regulator of RNase III)
MTLGHQLAARHVIHTVGPVYDGGGYGEAELLVSCYRESLRLATEAGLESVAFPCISTGIFGYPKAEACDIAISAVTEWLATHAAPTLVTFCCFSFEDAELYRVRLAV